MDTGIISTSVISMNTISLASLWMKILNFITISIILTWIFKIFKPSLQIMVATLPLWNIRREGFTKIYTFICIIMWRHEENIFILCSIMSTIGGFFIDIYYCEITERLLSVLSWGLLQCVRLFKKRKEFLCFAQMHQLWLWKLLMCFQNKSLTIILKVINMVLRFWIIPHLVFTVLRQCIKMYRKTLQSPKNTWNVESRICMLGYFRYHNHQFGSITYCCSWL